MKGCKVYSEIENLMWEYRRMIGCSDRHVRYYYQVKLDALYDLKRRLSE